MNKVSIDIFAETNPAFCALVLFHFCQGYYTETQEGLPLTLSILPLPIILSSDLSKSFEHTNTTTGFFKWINNSPEIILNLSSRINETSEYLNPAINYGIYKRILHINDSGLIMPLKQNTKSSKVPELVELFKYSDRLGKWIGQVNSTKTVYNYLGIRV